MPLIGLIFTLRFTLKSIIYLKTQPMGPMVDKRDPPYPWQSLDFKKRAKGAVVVVVIGGF